jgi:predicted 3-demethylubiquinone-9 3-methyltransferase (glyoxalase superfamily)
MQTIVPHLWFDGQAEEAARFYCSLFREAAVGEVRRYGKEGFEIHGQPAGRVLTVEFTLGGSTLVALNGGPHFQFTPAISLFVVLETRKEVDALWAGLAAGGEVMMPLDVYPWSERYGWLADRHGVSWQIMLGKREDVGRTITPALLFTGERHGQAEAALEHYVSIFPDSRVEGILRYDGSGPDPAGTVQHAQFYLGGETFMVMDNAHDHGFGFTPAISFMVRCGSQAEIDRYWTALSAVPEAEQCGWLTDRFGVSWQIAPTALGALLDDTDPARADRVMKALLAMKKLDLGALERAAAGIPVSRTPPHGE